MKKFKVRCSAISSIMSKPRNKTDLLSKTTETYVKKWLMRQLTGKQQEIRTKQMVKGVLMEQDGLDLIAKKMGVALILKNEKQYQNDYFTGTPDAIVGDYVIDNKCSWNSDTFTLFDTVPDKGYVLQLNGYMELTGKKKAKLIYTLIDCPEHLIEREARYYCNDYGYEFTEEIYNQFTKNMTYPDVPEEYKYKSFDIERSDSDIQLIKERVIECREYIKTLSITFK
ncbi:hypothetical protein LCGC14_1345620 [marine sediment metagenome]|uniref:YqaJ viral recombinase domain-containing protein n=1 Tax=marine sediment metagenome TaxID=412755 RepID=A0A0F9NEU5_9ZZZZ